MKEYLGVIRNFGALGLVIAIGIGCSTTRINLYTSPPGAKVYGKPMGQGELKALGTTPLTLTSTEIEKRYDGSGPVYFEFRREGFVNASTVVTELSALDLNINVEMTPENGLEDQGHVNGIIDTMFECQRLARVKRYDEALDKLKIIEREAPQISAIYELEGGIYYLQGKYQDSLDAYRLAVRYNPKSAEAKRMENLLEQAYGIRRSPSSIDLIISPDTGGLGGLQLNEKNSPPKKGSGSP